MNVLAFVAGALFALVGILGVVKLAQSNKQDLYAWALLATGIAGVIVVLLTVTTLD
jgi:uncharacterized membrane protein HdeD (DUF308 family)